jgi:hypothetical protein
LGEWPDLKVQATDRSGYIGSLSWINSWLDTRRDKILADVGLGKIAKNI